MIGQSVGAYTDATHGMTLSAVSLPYYRYIMPYGVHKFTRFAEEIWYVRADGIAEGTIILEGGYKVLTKDDVVKILKESL